MRLRVFIVADEYHELIRRSRRKMRPRCIPYARSWNPPVSFGVSLERYGGEVPSAALAKLPTNVGWAPSRW